jgi:glyoxylase-like metal-dependent hydrolase (beta-lactamase superfamily II)
VTLRAADLGVTLPSLPIDRTYDPVYAKPVEIAPNLRRVLARNPTPFTFHGTGTYIVGRGRVAVIDPGPLIDEHVDALKNALKGETVTHILITHTHSDHSPAAAPFKAATGAPTYAYGALTVSRVHEGPVIEEASDAAFRPDHIVHDGDILKGDGWSFECVFTPGHISNHMCFAWREAKTLFSGDHVMGWSTTVIGPPDGDMAQYFASLEKLLPRDDAIYYPTHGGPITQPKPFVTALIAHRHAREGQIAACLRRGINRIPAMVEVIYSEHDKRLHPAAALSVLAHLQHMISSGRVATDGAPDARSVYRLAS